MQGIFGFGWNDARHTFTVDTEDIWNAHLKVDPTAKVMRFKSWPLFKYWVEIFSKDRATGENAHGFADAVNDILRNAPPPAGSNPPTVTPNSPFDGAGATTSSATHCATSSAPPTRRARKRKTVDPMEERFLEMMNNFCSKTDERLASLAQRIGFEQDAKAQRQAVFDTVAGFYFLTVEDKFTVCKRLCDSNTDMDLFFSVGDEQKQVMVKMIHEGRY